MSEQTEQFKRLYRRSMLSGQSGYLGDEHLYVLDGFYTESVRKLHYKDIEAILIARTKQSKVTGASRLCLW